ncbi:tRNA (cytosine(34)-C(5))-methyltransferase-like [Stylophora pistillata]|uniref:tRNA (cytosine(34)-C(5))-methyltransferase n=1 Tax=Stylophora pistillata TaxID=50429 RepID=A0A2B4RYH3_STYPI|nr:tRNA (cytosine(34)-C(5))-methyltransferase-like [Stylophora pistillata]PFX21833.1 tRNA (cytosine(34)-C(5))-methyltransferase [Stylophora pistillata]
MGKRKRRERSRHGNRPKNNQPTGWVQSIRKNDLYEEYYKTLNIVPEEEFPAFIAAMQSELPSTFRITGTRSHAQNLLNCIRNFFLDDMHNVQCEGGTADPPTPLPWYPNDLAWQINLTKRFIRKSASMEKFHNFLVHQTESGNISRQEAVSMIPPLLLDVKPGQKILDACAAPGSKTVQLIELLHDEESQGIPDGLVVANELQNKRCYMLVHQSKRLKSPCCLITNHDASLFPPMFIKGEEDKKMPIMFDRILCDVPCSGDGTMRKNPQIWKKWSPQLGLSLFRVQLRILARAVEMLATGGRIVYSTCTLNPIENEAVICTLLQKAEGAVELVDVSSSLPKLKRSTGLRTWKIMTKNMKVVDNCDPGTEFFAKGFKPEMLPPSEDVIDKLHIERCVRIYPHQQDTGGFFIAVLEKKKTSHWENGNRYSDNPRLLPWESMADWQTRKEAKCGKQEAKVTSRTPIETRKTDSDQCSVEQQTEKGTKSSEKPATCEFAINSQVDTDYCEQPASTNEVMDYEQDESDKPDELVDDNDSNIEKTELDLAEDDEANRMTIESFEEHDSTENGPQEEHSAGENKESDSTVDSSGDSSQVGQPPAKKAKVEMKGFKEDPFVFLREDDEHWPQIKEFYDIDDAFPVDQLLVRSVGGKKRNIYLVSKAVKDVMEMVTDEHKVVNTGMKVIARAEVDNAGCLFRLMQEGIEAVLPYMNKRKVTISQEDLVILLTQDRPFCTEFSSATKEQLDKIEDQGCIVYVYEPNGPYSSPEDTIGSRVVICGWKAKVSTRVQINKFDRTHYSILCGLPPGKKQKGKKDAVDSKQETTSKEGKDNEPDGDEKQPGFIGDFLNVEPPEGSLDVGFI